MPQVPQPSEETGLAPDMPPAPPSASASASGSIAQGTPAEDIPIPVSDLDAGVIWEGDWGDPFDPELMQQDQAMVYSTSALFRRGFWYSQAEVVALLRTENQLVYISADNSGAGTSINDLNAPLLSTKEVNPTYTPGTRLTLGRFLGQDVTNRDYTVEFAFLGLFDYSQTATIISLAPNGLIDGLGPGNHYFTTGVTGVMVGAATPGFGDAKQHDIQYDSDMNSFEMNFRILERPLRDRLDLQPNGTWVRNLAASQIKSLLIGLRAMSINEMFSLQASFTNPTTSGYYQVKTTNDMFGVQLGGEWIENYSRWSWGARFKAGGLFNFADRRSLVNVMLSGVPNPPRTEKVNSENLAAVLEGGLLATYQVRPNLLARVAYDAMYVQGIATATENLGLGDAFPKFEVTGDTIFHGLSVGFEMLW